MNVRQMGALLAAWSVLVVAPAYLVYALFFDADPDQPVIGWAILVWVIGYVAQLVVFMAVTRKSKGTNIGG